MEFIITSIIVFTTITTFLVILLNIAEKKLLPQGNVSILINDEPDNAISVGTGGTLLGALSGQKVFLPSACGGGGTCAMCKCQILEGGGDILPTEVGHLSRTEQKENVRLACQVKVKGDMNIKIPEEIFGIKKWEATVVRNHNVASFIKEFVVQLPEDMDYRPGGYIQIEIPECEIDFKGINIDAHPEEHDQVDKFQLEWEKFGLWDLKMKNEEVITRAYSMASYPAEGREVMLNVRIATPPFDRAKNGWMSVNPGIASSYIFSKKP